VCVRWRCSREYFLNGKVEVKSYATGCRTGIFSTRVDACKEVSLDCMPMCVAMLRKDGRGKREDEEERQCYDEGR
jgi:hypothetical protein